MNFKVTVNGTVKEFKNLNEAIEMIKIVASKLTYTAMIAIEEGKEELQEKCIKARNSIKMELVNGQDNGVL